MWCTINYNFTFYDEHMWIIKTIFLADIFVLFVIELCNVYVNYLCNISG